MESVRTFRTNYVLIDHENVHPDNIVLLSEDHFQIYLFVGAKQTRLNFDLVDAMHKFGPSRSKYVHVTQTAPNALDFHITYYLGVLATQEPTAYFHIISKDKGFDPLIEHVSASGLNVTRRESIADIPVLNVSKDADINEKFDAVVTNLIGRGLSKPRKQKTLRNTIKQTFKEELKEAEITAIFNKLLGLNYITMDKDYISYHLPKGK